MLRSCCLTKLRWASSLENAATASRVSWPSGLWSSESSAVERGGESQLGGAWLLAGGLALVLVKVIGVGDEGKISRSLFFDAGPFLGVSGMRNASGRMSAFA